MEIKQIKTHVRYKSAELVSVGKRNYFYYNGNGFSLTKKQLNDVNKEIDDLKLSNPLSASNYLISQVKRFKKITI